MSNFVSVVKHCRRYFFQTLPQRLLPLHLPCASAASMKRLLRRRGLDYKAPQQAVNTNMSRHPLLRGWRNDKAGRKITMHMPPPAVLLRYSAAVAASRATMLSSPCRAGENFPQVAEGAIPRNRSGKRTARASKNLESGTGAVALAYPPKGHPSCSRQRRTGSNLSGKADRWGQNRSHTGLFPFPDPCWSCLMLLLPRPIAPTSRLPSAASDLLAST